MHKRFKNKQSKGFTLAELLISLAILGVIATFTIPKILNVQKDQEYKSAAREAIGAVSAAYSIYKTNNIPTAATGWGVLTPYLNYVRIDTMSPKDDTQGNGTYNCTNSQPCYQLHSGGFLQMMHNLGGTAPTNAMGFMFDPDARVTDGTTNGPGKSVRIFMYYSGRITSSGGLDPNTTTSSGVFGGPYPQQDPPWFTN